MGVLFLAIETIFNIFTNSIFRRVYAVIDIETTGGKFNEEGITEIAIYKFDGHQVIDQLITLLNPEIPIQPFVVQLTGINNNMLRTAPKFYEVAKDIVKITEDCIFVAHNANFDYRIVKNEFSKLGYQYERDTLCTVELSRKLLPNQPSYSLGKLCRNLGIPTSDRHRASGDASATVKLLKLLISKDLEKNILTANIKSEGIHKYQHDKKKVVLLDKAPAITGVYYLHNEKGDIIYAAKHKNIKNSFNKILLRTSRKAKQLHALLHDFSYEETGSDLIAQIKFEQEIAIKKPKFNTNTKKHLPTTVFNIQNAILVDIGRNIAEKTVILIENGMVKGYAYVDLSYQITHLSILKNLLIPIADNLFNRYAIKTHLDKGKFKKIIRFEETSLEM